MLIRNLMTKHRNKKLNHNLRLKKLAQEEINQEKAKAACQSQRTIG